MKPSLLRRIGTPSLERLGAAPNSVEMRQIANGYGERREIGRRILNLWQCACLRWNPRSAESCRQCKRARP